MRVLFKGMHRDVEVVDVDKNKLVSTITSPDYSKPFKIYSNIYLYEKVYSSFGEDLFNGYVKCRTEKVSLFEECYIVKKALFGYKTLSDSEINKIKGLISENKPLKW